MSAAGGEKRKTLEKWAFRGACPQIFPKSSSRDFVHSGEYGKQIIGRVMLGYFLTGK